MELSLVEVIFRLIPEALFVNYCITILSHNKFDKKKYIKACVIAIICVYIIRSLPISSGMHIILNILSFEVIHIFINKYDVIPVISSVIRVFVGMMLIEGVNMLAITFFSKQQVNNMVPDNGIGKVVMGIPSIIAYAIISFILYRINKKRGESIDDNN